MTSADWYASAVMKAADRIGKSFRFMYRLDPGDVSGVVTVYAYEQKTWLEITAREQPGLFEFTLRQHANSHYRRERVRALRESDAYFYDPEYVRLFLPYFFSVEDWVNGPVNEDASSKWQTGEAIDTALDIKGGWSGLKGWQARAITARHLTVPPNPDGGVDWDAIASRVGLQNGDSARARYADATRELTFEMNVNRADRLEAFEGPGARDVLSNVQASAAIRASA